MMAQYRRIKGELPPDALLFFRLGDFYELFFEDAQVGAQLLNVALTKRGTMPMCGIPFHAANGYIARLLRAGRKVAICEQLEEARPGALVKREVTQILSPGTHFDERLLVPERNNFLAALYPCGKVTGLAMVDLTTGDFRATEAAGEGAVRAELDRLRPAELIYPAGAEPFAKAVNINSAILNAHEDWVFAPETAIFTVRDHFKVASLDGFGLKNRTAGDWGGRGHPALPDAKSAAGRVGADTDFILSGVGFHGAGYDDAADAGGPGIATGGRRAKLVAIWRSQPHRDADGGAAAARMADAAAGDGGSDHAAAGRGAGVDREWAVAR